jgi:ubiquinone biosynthesis accessory factor UbiJ
VFSSIKSKALWTSVNHVLGQHAWARQLLSAHAGKTIRLCTDLPELPLLGKPPEPFLQITPEGQIAEPMALDSSAASVTVSIAASQMLQGLDAVKRSARVEGDAELALVLGQIAQHVRWDPAEDLARWTGDATAQTLVTGVQSLGASASQFFKDGVRHSTLLGAEALAEHREQIAALSVGLARLEQRVSAIQ